jgi:predicted PurR-regulated permease PerM
MAPQRTRRPARGSFHSPDPKPGRVAGAVIAAAAAVALLWFLYQIMTALLLFFFALVVSIALAAVVRWLKRRGLSRRIAASITLAGFFGMIALIIYAIVPPLAEQVASLAARLPDILSSIGDRFAAQLTDYPDLQQWVHADNKVAEQLLPTAARMLAGVGGVSLSLLGALTLFVIFMSAVIYLVADPLPLMRGYAYALPRRYRVSGLRAYARASRAVLGWVRASVVIGPIEAVLSGIFLSLMHVPGALVWAALARTQPSTARDARA